MWQIIYQALKKAQEALDRVNGIVIPTVPHLPAGNALLGYPTVADLRAETSFVANQVGEAFGADVPGDGGGGRYYFEPTSVVADNGSTYLKPNSVAGGSPGRWLKYA